MIKAYLEKMNILVVETSKEFHEGELFNIVLYRENEKVNLLFLEKANGVYKYEVDYTFGHSYNLKVNNGFDIQIDLSIVVRTKEFDERYKYDGFLGSRVINKKTEFVVWAPTAEDVCLFLIDRDKIRRMKRSVGVYSIEIPRDLTDTRYMYLVKRHGVWVETTDPYNISNIDNSKHSVVYNLEEVSIEREEIDPQDAIIYELHIRDYTQTKDISHNGKYLGLIESDSLSYIKDLGVTHIQLQPIYDFGSVVEGSADFYNWGYDPVNCNIPEGWYASGKHHYSKIDEIKELIDSIHKAGLKVNVDMVFNHVFNMQAHSFEKIVPGYYFRYKDDELSNGSFCGNDIESSRYMSRRFIKDTIKRWITYYGVDGFRIDLMGIHDVKTMNDIRGIMDELSPGLMLYGEGWEMPTLYDGELATIKNHELMPRIGMFNDYFRDNLKRLHLLDLFVENILPLSKSVNYVECHDDETLFDFVKDKAKHKLITTLLILAPGILFIHAGQEFFRTKKGVRNTYCAPDEINALDWESYLENIDYVNYIREMIKFRKEHNNFLGYSYELNESDISALKISGDSKIVVTFNKTDKLVKNLKPFELVYEVLDD